jgi:hypothetical protein
MATASSVMDGCSEPMVTILERGRKKTENPGELQIIPLMSSKIARTYIGTVTEGGKTPSNKF